MEWVNRNPKRAVQTNTAGEVRTYAGIPHFCRSPQFENVFIVPVAADGEEYRGDEGRTIPRSSWIKNKLVT